MQQQLTLRQTWRDYQLRDGLKPETAKEYESKLKRCVGDWLDVELCSITKNMVEERHRELSKKTPTQANSVFRIVRTLYNFAEHKYEDENEEPILKKKNPVKRLSEVRAWNKELPRDRHIPSHRIHDWFNVVLMMENTNIRDYLLLMLFTGLRHGEASTLLWDDVDFNGAFFTVRETKNGSDHCLPMSPLIFGVLKERLPDRTNEFVFPGGRHRKKGHLTSPYKAIEPLCDQLKLKWSPHDLRRTFQYTAEDLDIEFYWRKRLLNHSFSQDVTTKHYSKKNPEKLRPFLLQIQNHLLGLADLLPVESQ